MTVVMTVGRGLLCSAIILILVNEIPSLVYPKASLPYCDSLGKNGWFQTTRTVSSTRTKRRFLQCRVAYYANSYATFQIQQLTISGDVNPNPGPSFAKKDKNSDKCPLCNRTIARNHRVMKCNICNLNYHIKCVNVTSYQFGKMTLMVYNAWKCPECIGKLEKDYARDFANLPFPNCSSSPTQCNTIDVSSRNEERRFTELLENLGPPARYNLRAAHLNICSLRNKIDELRVIQETCKFDILGITETHLDKTVPNSHIFIDGMKFIRKDRTKRKGGGCILYYAEYLRAIHRKDLSSADIEAVWLEVKFPTGSSLFSVVYRPPNANDFFIHFESVLERAWFKSSNIFLMGDFNCDFSTTLHVDELGSMNLYSKKLLHLFDSYDMQNLICDQTRVTPNSSTLIDLFVTTRKELVLRTGTCPLGMSDHHLIHATIRLKNKRPPPKFIQTRNFKKINAEQFNRDIQTAPFHISYVFDDADDDVLWAWEKIFTGVCNDHAKPRTFKVRSVSQPWINSDIKLKMNKRFKLFRKAISTKEQQAWDEYKAIRNRITSDIKRAKQTYFQQKIKEVKSSRDYWNILNSATRPNTVKKSIIGPLKRSDESIIVNDQEKANAMNTYFANIGVQLANDIHNTPSFISDTIRPTRTKCITDIPLSIKTVDTKLNELQKNKSPGIDNIPPQLTILAKLALTHPLYDLLKYSIETKSIFPMWKTARLTPVFKQDDETDISNYRPISNLCTHSKILESCVADAVKKHVISEDLITDQQWAYRAGHSTELLLIQLTETWRTAIDNNLVVGAAFVDFRKAFDCISHTLLLHKLQYQFGITGNILSWITDYLTERKQFTIVNGKASDTETVRYGVPQGSVLGPLLFVLYTNDMPSSIQNGTVYMYADDTTLYVIGKSIDEVTMTLNSALSDLFAWCIANSLTPHPTKCEAMLFYRGSFHGPINSLIIGNNVVKLVTSTRLLGVNVDNKLNWTHHMADVKKGFLNKLNLLKRSHFLSTNLLIDLYFKVVLPSVTYALPVWGSSSNSEQFQSLEKLHIRAAKIIYNLPRERSGEAILHKVGWHTLFIMYKLRLLKFVYKVHNNSVPRCMDSFFLASAYNHYGLRSRGKHHIIVPGFNTVYMKQAIHRRGSILWNRMMDLFIGSKNIKHFCRLLSKSSDFLHFQFEGLSDQCKPKHNDMYVYF